MPSSNQLSSNQLRQALQLSEQIESLQQRLDSILGGQGAATGAAAPSPSSKSAGGGSKRTGRKMSPATLAKMRAAQQARWAKIKGAPKAAAIPSSTGSTGGKAKRTMSPRARAKIAAAQRARWAKQEKSGEPIVRSEAIKLPKKKGGLTAEGREKLAAAMKARWAARKQGSAAPNA
jgi:hypothetical protein